MKGYKRSFREDWSLSQGTDDSESQISLRVFQAIEFSNEEELSNTRNERKKYDTSSSNISFCMFNLSIIFLAISVILLIGILFFYPEEVGLKQSDNPKIIASSYPSLIPSNTPSNYPIASPSIIPSISPTAYPSAYPTSFPSLSPSEQVIPTITRIPTELPTATPSSSPSAAPTRSSITFYVLGDIPYDYDEEIILADHMSNIPAEAEFVFHVGDIMRPKITYCLEGSYMNVKQILQKSIAPVFVTIGDNDWPDCPDKDIAINYWRKNFVSFENNWDHSFRISRQPNMPENVAWFKERILFISVCLVGGKPWDLMEWSQRTLININWLKRNVSLHRNKIETLVIFGHANAGNSLDDFFSQLVTLSNNLAKPTLYIHGDGHEYYKRKNPYFNAKYLIDVQVDQGKESPPLKVTVHNDADDIDLAFEFDRRLGESS